MKRWITPMLLLALLQGCATRFDIRPASAPDDPQTGPASLVLMFQRSSIAPGINEVLLKPDALQAGDIILTSGPSLTSAGIQLMTLAPVSHAAVYIGDHQVVEAVDSGVRVRGIEELLANEPVVLAFRYPELTAMQARTVRAYALKQVGTHFSYLGVALHVPLAVNRRVCELPLMPQVLRDACIRGVGSFNYLASGERQLFCSQLVLQAYRHAGVPITHADPRLISPADILHMREGDVPSVTIHKPLHYVGYLKYQPEMTAALEQPAASLP